MQLKEEFRTYESLRREHDAQIVQIATEAGLRIAPDQWSALLYGDTAHKSHMQSIIGNTRTQCARTVHTVQIATEAGLRIAPDQWSALLYGDTAHKSHMQSIIGNTRTQCARTVHTVQIATEAGLRIAPDQWSALLYGDTAHKSHMQSIIDKLQTPQSFAQSVQELFIALQRTGDPAQLVVMSMHLDRLASIDASPDAKSPSWQQLAEIMTSLKEVVSGLIHYLQQQATGRDSNHNQKHAQERADTVTSQLSPSTAASTPTHTKYKVSMCRDAATRSFCPRGNNCTFAHSEEELERYRSMPGAGAGAPPTNGNYTYLPPPPPLPPSAGLPLAQNMPMQPMFPPRLPFHPHMDNYSVPPMPPPPSLPPPPPPPALPPEMLPSPDYPDTPHTAEGIQQQNYPTAMIHGQPTMMSQNGMLIPVPERPFYRYNKVQWNEYPQVYAQPNSAMYQSAAPMEQAAPIPGMYVNVPLEPPRDRSPYQFEELQPEMVPEYRVKPAFVAVPRECRPDPAWSSANEVFNFEGMHNALPHCSSSSEDMFNVSGERRAVRADRMPAAADLSVRADDELEEELQALERRIDTEFKSAD
ncbi:hypothetical protein O0L34_g2291 [Tuta absoluta]|nr:hypothetical protein O0L34_g2291 [Tuta absoluta]